MDGSSIQGQTQATVTEFLDETPGGHWAIPSQQLSNLVDCQPEIELAKYLSRPVLIKTHTWSQDDTADRKSVV